MNRQCGTPRARRGRAVIVWAALATTLLLCAAACTDAAERRPAPQADHLQPHHFQITRIIQRGRAERSTPVIDLFFYKDRTAGAGGGCNTLGYRWKIEHGRLVTWHWFTTLVNCPERLMKYDESIWRFLRARPTVVAHGSTLVLRTPTLEWRGTRLD
jgi:heat shock protein HslJ